jgi:hypothetical protein
MCNGFGAIVTAENVYFSEPDEDGNISHSEILRRLGWRENADPFVRRFVRVECADWTLNSFRFDENTTLPGWVDEAEVQGRIAKILATCTTAGATYRAARATAWATYEAARATAWATYEAARATAGATYETTCATAWATYKAARAPAVANMIAAFTKIAGYVPAGEPA